MKPSTTIHFLFSLLFLLLVGSAQVELHGFSRLRYSGAIRRKSQPKHSRTRNNSNDDVQEWHIPQQLDHFRLGDTRSFLQRYFSSNRYVRNFAEPNHALNQDAQPASFAFLCVGGEGPPLDESVLIDSVHCTGDMLELADRLFHERNNTSIHLFALEHRYYGKSYPQFENSTSPITNENLVYLSSRQAQADLAHFVSTQQASLPSNTQWVTFGGSYPGMMAAYARLRFPHLISAAVSSSAPVQATLDFAAYNGHPGVCARLSKIRVFCQKVLAEEDLIDALISFKRDMMLFPIFCHHLIPTPAPRLKSPKTLMFAILPPSFSTHKM